MVDLEEMMAAEGAVVLDQVDQRVVLRPQLGGDGWCGPPVATDRTPNATYRDPVFIADSSVARTTHRFLTPDRVVCASSAGAVHQVPTDVAEWGPAFHSLVGVVSPMADQPDRLQSHDCFRGAN